MSRRLPSLYNLKERLRKSSFIVLLGIILILISSIVTLITDVPTIYKLVKEQVFYQSYIKTKIENLVAGSQVSNFIKDFGEPVLVEDLGDNKYKDYIFINKLFYIDTVTDLNGNVMQYAITTRDPNFNPVFKSPVYDTFGHQYKVILGRTKFADLPEAPNDVNACVGAHTWSYYETHYLGNPSNYQTYAFGLNMSGFDPIKNIENLANAFDSAYKIYCHPDPKDLFNVDMVDATPSATLDHLREGLIINTYLITAPFFNGINNSFGIGPDYNKVRIFN